MKTNDRIEEILQQVRRRPTPNIVWEVGDDMARLVGQTDEEVIRVEVSAQVEAAIRIFQETDDLDYTIYFLDEPGIIGVDMLSGEAMRQIDLRDVVEGWLWAGPPGPVAVARWQAVFLDCALQCAQWQEEHAEQKEEIETNSELNSAI